MGLYRAPARATIASMSANPSPLSSLTSPGGGVMPQGEEVASFATYPEAQRAVDALSDQGFPVQHLAIIGTDLRQVERITERINWGRTAMSGAMSGLWIGMFFGIIMSVAGSSGPRLSFWACVLLGVLWGIIFQLFSYALTRGRRDFTSISQVVASRYSIIAAHEVREAAQALADINIGGYLMTQIMNRIKSAFKTITSNDETEKSEDNSMPFSITGTEEKVTKKIEKNEYEGFANGFPEWTLEPPQIAVRRKK